MHWKLFCRLLAFFFASIFWNYHLITKTVKQRINDIFRQIYWLIIEIFNFVSLLFFRVRGKKRPTLHPTWLSTCDWQTTNAKQDPTLCSRTFSTRTTNPPSSWAIVGWLPQLIRAERSFTPRTILTTLTTKILMMIWTFESKGERAEKNGIKFCFLFGINN